MSKKSERITKHQDPDTKSWILRIGGKTGRKVATIRRNSDGDWTDGRRWFATLGEAIEFWADTTGATR